ncbi:molybdate ABC transporter substrate-binding protein [Bacillus tianshenii]|nr:molybdate ABC transporter substrate-binding protein [Bacillus tianshenii]
MKQRKVLYVGAAVAFITLLTAMLSLQAQSVKSEKTTLIVGAASSFLPMIEEIEQEFEQAYPNIDVRFHVGGSGLLARQIEAYAPIDVCMLASAKEFHLLEEKGRVQEKGAGVFLKNKLVSIQPKGAPKKSLNDLVDTNNWLAIGTPGAVPVGTYAKEALRNGGKWEQAHDHLVFGKDTHQVLTLVEQREVGAGIVYKTDAKSSHYVQITDTIPEDLHRPIHYMKGVLNISEHKEEAEAFTAFLSTEKMQALFESYGFEVK